MKNEFVDPGKLQVVWCERCGDEWTEADDDELDKDYICSECSFESGTFGDTFNIDNE